MIGVLDSGAGGAFALSELRSLRTDADIVFFADRKNAPYGDKSNEELIRLLTDGIDRLRAFGAEKILIACCTASTVFDMLTDEDKSISVPIIYPTAKRAAEITLCGRIGVLSTEATKKSGAFVRAIGKISPECEVFSLSAPELVSLAESGAADGRLTEGERKIIEKNIRPFQSYGIDTLILGCTHFAYFEREIENILGVRVVNSARIGAEEVARLADRREKGRTVYL